MKFVNTREYFPILFYEFQWTEDEIRPLLEEMQDKKKVIKKRFNPDGYEGVDNYWTDYADPEKLLEYDKLIEEICTTFLPELQCNHLKYWTAIYGEKGYHPAHQHTGNLFLAASPNMSSVLYLSNIGVTHFLNPNQIGVNHQDLYIQSEVGKMFMWPAHLLHRAITHRKKDEERVVVSSNWQISEKL